MINESEKWKGFVESYNDTCPKCEKRIERFEDGIECSRTRRGTCIYFHRNCKKGGIK